MIWPARRTCHPGATITHSQAPDTSHSPQAILQRQVMATSRPVLLEWLGYVACAAFARVRVRVPYLSGIRTDKQRPRARGLVMRMNANKTDTSKASGRVVFRSSSVHPTSVNVRCRPWGIRPSAYRSPLFFVRRTALQSTHLHTRGQQSVAEQSRQIPGRQCPALPRISRADN